jgi:hypothetical protein
MRVSENFFEFSWYSVWMCAVCVDGGTKKMSNNHLCTSRVGSTAPWRIRLKACVDLGDRTAEFIPFEVIRTAISTYFYLFLGINLRILISVINTRFQLDTPGWCSALHLLTASQIIAEKWLFNCHINFKIELTCRFSRTGPGLIVWPGSSFAPMESHYRLVMSELVCRLIYEEKRLYIHEGVD